jgi:outer membrane protein
MRSIRSLALSVVIAAGIVVLVPMALHWAGPGVRLAHAQAPAAAATPRFAYIRSQDVLAQTPGRAELEQKFNKEVDSARAVEKIWGDSINAMLGDLARNDATMSADQKTARQAQVREKQAQYQQRAQALEKQVQDDNQRMVAPIYARVNTVLEAIRNEGNYAFIFDAQAQGGSVLAADKNLDITDQVITRMRAAGPLTSAPSTGAPTKSPAGPTSAPSGVTRPKG